MIVEVTVRIRICLQTGGQMDGRGETNIPPPSLPPAKRSFGTSHGIYATHVFIEIHLTQNFHFFSNVKGVKWAGMT